MGCAKKTSQEDPVAEADKLIGEIEGLSYEESTITTSAQTPEAMTTDTMMVSSSEVFDNPSIQAIQEALRNAGLYTGELDGVLGPKTKRAIREFQSMNNLTIDGKVGRKTWAKLKPYLTSTTTTETLSEVSN